VRTDGKSSSQVLVMEQESPHPELMRLLREQLRARQNEIYGGLSQAEQAEYNTRAKRIRELEEIQGLE
jgi:hypothetical protein